MPNQPIVHIVEDDKSTLGLLENLICKLGYDSRSYSDGQKAYDAFSIEKPEIVISDWMLPGIDGLGLCQFLREHPADNYTYFILVTAQKRSRSNLEQAIDAGVDDFLNKPINSEAIWNRLRVAQRILHFTQQVRQLESIIPICCYCKKVRNDSDLWEQIEHYMNERTGADFSHSICPSCMTKHVRPQLDKFKADQAAAQAAENN